MPTSGGAPQMMHTIDGQKFDGNVGQVMLLNTAEEWKIENRTVNGAVQNGKIIKTDPPGVVDHPFHIHINPFQIVEFFDPNEVLPGTATYKYVFEGTPGPGQCLLDISKPETWKPCDPSAEIRPDLVGRVRDSVGARGVPDNSGRPHQHAGAGLFQDAQPVRRLHRAVCGALPHPGA